MTTDSGCFSGESSSGYQQISVKNLSGNAKSFECYACRNKLASKAMLVEHFRRFHSGNFPFSCKHRGCNRLFPSTRQLNVHIKTHARPFECEYCFLGFTTWAMLSKHLQMEVCRKESFQEHLQQYTDLRRKNHMKPNVSSSKFVCVECNKGFHEDTQMIRHLEQVHQTGPIKKRGFKSKETNHIKMHTRRYKCVCCNMCNKHVRAELCKKKLFKNKFQQYAVLREKNRPNDVIKKKSNYLCGKCTEGFEREEQLVLHLKDTHNIDIVFCLICDLPLENENSRSEHVVKYHIQQE